MKNVKVEGKLLDQKELADIFAEQLKGNFLPLQENQINLKTTLVNNYRENWKKLTKDRPDIQPVFDLNENKAQEIKIDADLAERYNLLGHLKEFDKKSDNSTAGIRAFYDILHSENPSMMYNDLFLALLIHVEAGFLVDVHLEIKNKLKTIENTDPGFKKLVKKVRTVFKPADLKVIEDVYGMPISEILPFIKDNMVKLVGGEVRSHTAKFVELEARILAAHNIMVIAPENYSDTVPIYMHSFMAFILNTPGATNYTPSHSANYLFGRKILAIGGGQLLPDKYEIYRQTLRELIEGEIINGQSITIHIAEGDHPCIKKSLTYKRMAKLYSSSLNVTTADVKTINEATKKGHKIVLNSLNGSTWKTLSAIMDELGIDKSVFEHIYQNEDPFFDVGYTINQKKDTNGNLVYTVDHLGTDVSMTKVATTIPYAKLLADAPIGRKLYECDADSDRYCVKQVVENNKENLQLVAEYGIDAYRLDDERMLVALSPNKMFLLLDVADYERMEKTGEWDKYYSLYLITYVSTRAWAEFGDAIPGMVKIMTRVGYKNLTEMQQAVEKWYFDANADQNFEFKDQIGNSIKLDRDRIIRVHSKQEESGGRVAGINKECFNIILDKTLAMPEKSDPDSVLSELTLSAQLYLDDLGKMSGEYRVLNLLDRVFKKYGLISKIDARIDLMHGDQGAIALMPYREQQKALEYAGFLKSNFNNFFFSLGKEVRDGNIDIEKVKAIMKEVLPEFSETWQCIESMTLCEENLSGGRKRPEGVPLTFKQTADSKPIVTELDFRPSGTDPLKSKIYIDAETLKAETKLLIEEKFSALTLYDLHSVLEEHGVNSIEPRPVVADTLKKIG